MFSSAEIVQGRGWGEGGEVRGMLGLGLITVMSAYG